MPRLEERERARHDRNVGCASCRRRGARQRRVEVHRACWEGVATRRVRRRFCRPRVMDLNGAELSAAAAAAGGESWEVDDRRPSGHVLVVHGDTALDDGEAGWVTRVERERSEGRVAVDAHQDRSKAVEERPKDDVPYRCESGDGHQGRRRLAGDPEVFVDQAVFGPRVIEGQENRKGTGDRAEDECPVDAGKAEKRHLLSKKAWQIGVHREFWGHLCVRMTCEQGKCDDDERAFYTKSLDILFSLKHFDMQLVIVLATRTDYC